ncbi:MAG: sigma-70 family RNA polymerase sigma factor [Akkermansiaceae bacterium]|nr:sigma-70 family RNA polymerase sigma factor [Akkermansiaceae bacterium]
MNEDTSVPAPTESGELSISGRDWSECSPGGLGPAGCENSEASVFASYYMASRASIRAYLFTILKDAAACEDCMQEAALEMWKKRQADWSLLDFRKLAFTYARFKALSWLKKNKPAAHLHLSPELSEKISMLITSADTSNNNIQTERVDALRECIGSLPTKQRELIEARYAKKHAEALEVVAIKQSLSMNTVYKQLERVRTKLRKCIHRKLDRRS